jgi:PAS domain S-box-containing protein
MPQAIIRRSIALQKATPWWAPRLTLPRAYRTVLTRQSSAPLRTQSLAPTPTGGSGATRIFGFTSEEAVGSSLELIIPENLRARHWAGYTQVMATGHYGQGDLLSVPGLTKDGRRISVEFTIALLHAQGRELVGTAAILRDATKRFEEIRELRRQLRKSSCSDATDCQHGVFPSESGSVK